MRISYRVFWLPKAGLNADEYEDAFAPEEASSDNLTEFRCAVSDGATETSFSGQWAKILCAAYNEKNFDLTELQAKWLKEVSGKELPWYAEQKLESGAFATICGLTLSEMHGQLHWSMRALGDSCLFHIRNGGIIKAAPLENWEDFDYTPVLLSTSQEANRGILSKQVHDVGTCESGDIFYLMTDAISKWLLRREKEQGDGIAKLEAISSMEEFEKLVESERHSRDDKARPMMPNDDVTWTRVHVGLALN